MENFLRKHPLLSLLGGALLYGLLLALLGNPDRSNDSGQYLEYAKNLLATGVYGLSPGIPDLHREPAYGIWLAILLRVCPFEVGDWQLLWIVFVQACLHFIAFGLFSFSGLFRKPLDWIYFLLCIFSPTLAGTATVIYSETLAISLIAFFLMCIGKRTHFWSVLGGIALGFFLLTKLSYVPLVYLFFSIWFFSSHRRFAQTLSIAAVIALLFVQAWNLRNSIQFGPDAVNARSANALAGKILRVAKFESKDIPIAFTAAVGTNLCYRIYGDSACQPFEIRGADAIGFSTWNQFVSERGSPKEAKLPFLKYVFKEYLRTPFRQILGSVLESVRMFFFEASQPIYTNIKALQLLQPLWHFFGSLGMWFFFLLGLRASKKGEILVFLPICILLYHWILMAQITNLVRYVYPVIPCIYLFVARGIEKFRERFT